MQLLRPPPGPSRFRRWRSARAAELFRTLRRVIDRHQLWLVILIGLLGSFLAVYAARILVEQGVVDALIEFWKKRSSG